MPYSQTVTFPPEFRGGGRATFSEDAEIPFSQLFSGTPQHYPGSTIRCQEIVTLVLQVYDQSLVDVDFEWYNKKQYLGNYRLLQGFLLPSFYPEDSGFIEQEFLKIRRYSEYTVTANPSTPVALGEQSIIDNCNFQLVTNQVLFGAGVVPVSNLSENKAVFRIQDSLTKVDLEDTVFNRKIIGIGFYLKPGVEALRAEYQAAIINEVRVSSQPFPSFTCTTTPSSCSGQFDAFLDADPDRRYISLGACQRGDMMVACELATFICPSDPSQTFNYYRPIEN